MMYTRRSFSVAMTEGKTGQCAEKGHSGADSRGRCYCCGEQIAEPAPTRTNPLDDPRMFLADPSRGSKTRRP